MFSISGSGEMHSSKGQDNAMKIPWQAKCSSHKGVWAAAFAIPFDSIGMKVHAGDTWGMTLIRTCTEEPVGIAAWTPIHRTEKKFLDPAYYACITFAGSAPALQLGGIGG